jgi:hypothetical protein
VNPPALRLLIVTLAFSSNTTVLAAGQSSATGGELTGTVRDRSQAVLRDAAITARKVATNLERTTLSDAVGRFSIPALPPGSYEVVVQLKGFAPETRSVRWRSEGRLTSR